jgi:Uma2 family endonuclease
MLVPAKRNATYADVLAAPEHVIAELMEGSLYLHPSPPLAHVAVSSALTFELGPPFSRGRGGPGGWHILPKVEVHLGANVLVPDLSAWRHERLPELRDEPFLTLTPDWICEITTPQTADFDRQQKLPLYARAGVAFLWIVDPWQRSLEAFRLEAGQWTPLGSWKNDALVRAEPFSAVLLELGVIWDRVTAGPDSGVGG